MFHDNLLYISQLIMSSETVEDRIAAIEELSLFYIILKTVFFQKTLIF
jgi:hypothetical protein